MTTQTTNKSKKKSTPFTDTAIKKLPLPEKGRTTTYDTRTPGLCVRISATGNRVFYVVKKRGSKPVWLHLGAWPGVPAHVAQRLAIEALSGFADPKNDVQAIKRALVSDAKRDSDEKLAREAIADKISLAALCDAYVQHLHNQDKQSEKNVKSLFNVHLKNNNPLLASKAAREVSREDINSLIKSVADPHRRTANKLRSYLLAAYNLPLRADSDPNIRVDLKLFGIESNPVRDTMPLSGANKPGERSLNKLELLAYTGWLVTMPTGNIKDALILCLLLGGQRVSQLLRVTSNSFDSDRCTLELLDPKGKRTAPRLHILPLHGMALEIVKRLAFKGGSLFATKRGITNLETLSNAVAEISAKMVLDGKASASFSMRDIRRTAETHLAELKVSKDVRAQLLSHGLSGVQGRHYDKYEYLPEKLDALQVWTEYLAPALESHEENKQPS